MSDVELSAYVERAKKGDEEAIAALIEHTQQRLFRFCFHLCGNKQLAHDLCQDTYVKVLEQLASVREAGAFWTWLFRTAKHLFIDYVRSPRNDEPVQIELLYDAKELVGDTSIEQILQVHATLKEFDPESRSILLLIDMEGYTYAEVAEIIGISEAAVRSRLHRVRKEFLNKYERA